MQIENYNQYEDYYLRNSCSIVSLLNIMKYRYWVLVKPTYIIKIAVFLEKLWVFNPSAWASFSIIDKAFVIYLNKLTKLNFKLEVNQISKLKASNKDTYQLWIKSYSTRTWAKIKADWFISKEDIDYLSTRSGWIGHATNWDWSQWGKFIDTDWGKNTDFSLNNLKYWEIKGIFRDNIRTISPNDEETRKITTWTIQLFRAEKKWTLDAFLEMNKNNEFLTKAKELYFYGRQ